MTPGELLAEARAVASHSNRKLGATRYIAASLLARQALEKALDLLWKRVSPDVAACSGRAQLITLQFYAEPSLAGEVAYAWIRLSRACHHDAYQLPPTRAELMSLFSVVTELAELSNSTDEGAVPGPSSPLQQS